MDPVAALLVGVAVGLIAFAGSMIGIVVTRRDGDRWRFAEQKRGLYVDLIVEAERAYKVLDVQTSEGSEFVRGVRATEPTAAVPETTPVEIARDAIRLVAPKAVVKAADALFCSVASLGRDHSWHAGQAEDPRGKGWAAGVAAYRTTTREFIAAARKDLGADSPRGSV